MWQHLKNNQLKYGFGVVLALILLILLDAYICRIFIKDFKLISNVFQCLLNHIDTTEKIKPSSLGAGIIAIIGLILFFIRLKKQQKQIDIQIDQRIDERFNSAIGLLGSSETSARTGAIYALYELAKEEEKYREQIAQILCSHIRSKTNEDDYKKAHKERPSNEIQTTINLLFKEKSGLYAQDFAKEDDFPKADLSHAYLTKANFRDAKCQGTNFRDAKCQGVDFSEAQCQGANFRNAKCQRATFWSVKCQGADFQDAECQGADFRDAQCQGANFRGAECQIVCFVKARCQGMNFSTECQEAEFEETECQGSSTTVGRYQLIDRINKDTSFKRLTHKGPIDENTINKINNVGGHPLHEDWHGYVKDAITKNNPESEKVLGVPNGCVSGKLEDSKEIQAIINQDWEKLEQLQNAE